MAGDTFDIIFQGKIEIFARINIFLLTDFKVNSTIVKSNFKLISNPRPNIRKSNLAWIFNPIWHLIKRSKYPSSGPKNCVFTRFI